MSKTTRLEYLENLKPKYLKAGKKEKTRMLNELVDIAGYNRKYAIRILSAKTDLSVRKNIPRKKKKCFYDPEVVAVLRKIWELLDYPCGTRLKAAVPFTLESLERCGELKVSSSIRDKLFKIHPRTIDRRLKREKVVQRIGVKKNFATTKPGTLKSKIPVRKGAQWEENMPGLEEIDTVAHNGGDPSGEFVYTLNTTDIYSGWSEPAAGLGKAEKTVIEKELQGMIIPSLPFGLRGIDGDNGSEIINILLYKYCKKNNILFTRARPYKSNDNAHVEQKNWTHIRKMIGYGRLDRQEQVNALNDLYRNELRLYINFFQPHMKCVKKEYSGSKCKRKYSVKTPCQHLMDSKHVSKEQKRKLEEVYLSLNPVELKKSIDKKLDYISKIS